VADNKDHRCFCCGNPAPSRITRKFLTDGTDKNVVIFCCSEECKEEIDRFLEYNNKNYRNFLYTGVFCMLLLIASYILYKFIPGFQGMIYVSLILLAATFLRFPFATWKLYQVIGLRRLQWVIRIIAVLVIALGLFGVFNTYFM